MPYALIDALLFCAGRAADELEAAVNAQSSPDGKAEHVAQAANAASSSPSTTGAAGCARTQPRSLAVSLASL